MSLPSYSEYRDSGVEWLGDVPSHWAVRKFRHAFQESSEKIDGDVFGPMLSVSGYRGIEIKDYDDENRRRTDEELQGYRIVRPGQLVVNTMWLNYAGLGVSPHEGHVSPAYRAYSISEDLEPRFVHHMMRSGEFVKGYTKFLTGIRPNSLQMSRDDLMEFRLAEPPRDEQASIADFLDRETARIDALIAEQETLLALLAEKRQATISHAVTRGLDPNVPMKDSGIAWLGEVPAHWEVGPIKRYVEILDGRRVPLSAEERSYRPGDFPYYGASGIIDSIDDYLFDEDLVLVSEDGANLLNRSSPIAFVARGRYWVNNHAHILRPVDGLVDFWAARIEQLDLAPVVTGSAQPKLTIEALANLLVAVPPSALERQSIGGHLEQHDRRVSELESSAKEAIYLLKERRSALISAAVTGQIDVRGLESEEAA